MGRRKVSEAEKKKRGTTDTRRTKTPVVKVLENYPQPTSELSEPETEIYNRICKHLMENGALYDADCFIVTHCAKNLGLADWAWKEMLKQGAIQTFQNGARQVSPEWAVYKNAVELFMKQSRLLALDPKSRLDHNYFLDNEEEDDDEIGSLMRVG